MGGGSVLPAHLGVSPETAASFQRVVCSLCRDGCPKCLTFMGVHTYALLIVLVPASLFPPHTYEWFLEVLAAGRFCCLGGHLPSLSSLA